MTPVIPPDIDAVMVVTAALKRHCRMVMKLGLLAPRGIHGHKFIEIPLSRRTSLQCPWEMGHSECKVLSQTKCCKLLSQLEMFLFPKLKNSDLTARRNGLPLLLFVYRFGIWARIIEKARLLDKDLVSHNFVKTSSCCQRTDFFRSTYNCHLAATTWLLLSTENLLTWWKRFLSWIATNPTWKIQLRFSYIHTTFS